MASEPKTFIFCGASALPHTQAIGTDAYPELEAHQNEHDEFDHLTTNITMTENFEKVEFQRFLTLWWVGHIVGSGKKYRSCLAPPLTV